MPDRNLIQRHPKLGGDQLRPRGFVALAVGRRPGDNGDRAVRIRPDGGAFEEVTLRTEARHLDIGRKADSHQPTGLARLLLLGAEPVVAGDRQRVLEGSGVIAAVVQLAADAGRWLVECRQQVPPAHVGGIDAKLAGGEIDHSLDQEDRFRPAGAAIGRDRRLVCVDAANIDLQCRQAVTAVQQPAGETRQSDAHRVGAEVGGELNPQPAQRPIGVHRQLRIEDLVSTVRGRLQVLGPLLHPFHRPSDPQGGPRHQQLLRVNGELGTEAATDLGRDDPHRRLGKV